MGESPQGLHEGGHAAGGPALQLDTRRPVQPHRQPGRARDDDELCRLQPEPAPEPRLDERAHHAGLPLVHEGRHRGLGSGGRGADDADGRGRGHPPRSRGLSEPEGGDHHEDVRRGRSRPPVHRRDQQGRGLPHRGRGRAARQDTVQRRTRPVEEDDGRAHGRVQGEGGRHRVRLPDEESDARGTRVPHEERRRESEEGGVQEPRAVAESAGRLDEGGRRPVGR
mmetsp:Transcript_18107/g.41614  ORF Transcript_18107/g.41614 Transcript_18107/m.41614 type:complete len:224 (-) Transcript_18107:1119-1790(-)